MKPAPTYKPNPTDVGRKVLAALEHGRDSHVKQARDRAALVHDLAMADAQAGRSKHGRAGRVARKLPFKMSERQVKRILDILS